MKWDSKTAPDFTGLVQRTTEGTTRVFDYYYIKQGRGVYKSYIVGRYTFGREIDYRETFYTLKDARDFCAEIDSDTLIIEEVTA